MADTVLVTLTGLRARGHHGVHAFERREGQDFVVDAVLEVARPSQADDLATTVDYGALAQQLSDAVERDPVDLIETLAARLADTCLRHELVRRATVTVHKPSAPIAVPFADVSVTLTRERP